MSYVNKELLHISKKKKNEYSYNLTEKLKKL